MAIWLKQSTAVDIAVGPFVDSGDGVTAETGLTISQADVRLKKNGGAWAQKNDANAATHEENGYYEVALNTTDTDTLGRLRVAVSESGALPVWQDFMVVPANVWDSMFGADKLQVDAVEWLGGTIATPTTTGVPEVDLTHIAGSAVSTTTAQIGVNVVQISGDSGAADNLEAAADGTGYNLGGGSVVAASVTGAVGSVTGNVGGNVTGSVGSLAVQAKADVNAEVDTALSDYDPPTRAEATSDKDAILTRLGTPAGADVSTDIAAVKTQTAAIEVDTQDLQSRIPAALTGAGNLKADVLAISGDTTAADRLEALMDGLFIGQVNDASATTTQFAADGFTEATNDHLNGRLITFISGALTGQQTAITDYVGATQTLTVTALTEAPADNDFFIVH